MRHRGLHRAGRATTPNHGAVQPSRRAVALGALAALAIATGVAAPATAGAAPAGVATFTVAFTTAGCTPWTVPAGTSAVHVDATGSAGQSAGSSGGAGDEVSGDLPAGATAPGSVLTVCVAVGGGNGGGGNFGGNGGAGGGASGVGAGSDFAAPLVVAGGGGGGGGGDGCGDKCGGSTPGGAAGVAATAAASFVNGNTGDRAGGGGGATQSAPGAGGGTTDGGPVGSAGTSSTGAGPGSGGAGGTQSFRGTGGGGGGGGGGWFGGGGGASLASFFGGTGGGGGSDYVASAVSNQVITSGAGSQYGSGAGAGYAKVVITYTAPLTGFSNTVAPTITSGPYTVGQSVSVISTGAWSTPFASTFTYQWQDCTDSTGASCQPISGAMYSSYQLGASDIGSYLGVVVTDTDSQNQVAVAQAVATSPVPRLVVNVAVSGTQTYGGAASFTYNAASTPGATITGTVVCTGVGGGPITPALPAQTGRGYPIDPTSCSGLTLTGPQANQYTLAYTIGRLFVAPAPLTVTASSQSTVYGSAPAAVTASYAGLQNGDTAPATAPTCSTTASASSKVGPYPATCTGGADPNYTLTYVPGSVTVNKAGLVITASSGTSAYGAAPATVTPSYAGLVNGDAAPATPPTCGTTATKTSRVGNYPTSCIGAADPNYAITYNPGVDAIAPGALTVVASSQVVTYGTKPAPVTASYNGLVGTDTAPATLPTCSTAASATSKVGRYAATCSGAADPNYTITYVPGTVVVNPAALTITASSRAVTYGQAPGSVTASYTGLTAGDVAPATPPTCSTSATSASKVGAYATTCSGAADPNYAISYVTGSVAVTAAPLTVTASSQSIAYGSSPAAVTPAYGGLVNGDKSPAKAPTCSTPATASSPVGTYASTCAEAADPNYAITYLPGTVTVTPAAVTIAVGRVSVVVSVLTNRITFTATVTNVATRGAAVGASVTFSATPRAGTTLGCTAVTTTGGVATCTSSNPIALLLLWPQQFTATVTAGNYQAATATGRVTLI